MRIVKRGFAPVVTIRAPARTSLAPGFHNTFNMMVKLRREVDIPSGMVPALGGGVVLNYPLAGAHASVDAFLIDRHEVTNEEYKKFVDAGGTVGASSGSSLS